MLKKFLIFLLILVIFLVIYLIFPVKVDKKIVEIPYGTPYSKVVKILKREGVLRNELLFNLLHRVRKKDLKSGEYLFEGYVFPWQVYFKLERGQYILHKVVIPEGYDLFDVAKLLQKKGIAKEEEFLKWATDEKFVRSLGIPSKTAEGFLFPDTYYFPKFYPPKRIIKVMWENFLKKTKSLREELKKKKDLDLLKWVIIASLVEKETSREEERPIVAQVILKRLKRRMRLQIDPTLIYMLKRRGEWNGNIKLYHKKIKDPYNTYLYYGLPPTPICNPSLSSLRAVLFPAKTDYLYFVSNGRGGHYFFRTYREHRKFVRKLVREGKI